jgi:toxin-antitoxin system PIN domain toxin
MRLIDANLLIYAKFSDLPQHEKARMWLETQFNSPGRIGLPWESCLAFLRLSTNSRLFDLPLSGPAAWEQIEEWLSHPRVWIPLPTVEHPNVLGGLIMAVRATGNLVPDAHLAALAIQHGLILCSSGSDFARFPGLRWENPLVA